jgi:5-methylcytosine-specific restriction endonuclease McrA
MSEPVETAPSAGAIAGFAARLASLSPAPDDSARIDRLRALEELKSAVAAAQLRETAEFVTSQRERQRERQRAVGVPAERVGRGVAAQVALAKRISPHQASRYVQAAVVLTAELPATMTALEAGATSEWRALLVARETAWLSRQHRATVDRQLAPRLGELGDRAVENETKRLAYRLDPAGYVERLRAAENDRRVGLRPAPDAMTRLTALLPVAQGVAAYAALRADADTRTAAGDPRTRGQVMADTLVERLTGQSAAGDVPIEIGLVMTDRALLQGDGEPAVVEGFGTIPAATARDLVTRPNDQVPITLRQLYTHPASGQLIAMSSRRRHVGGLLRRFVAARDQYCRTPWCGAPIRHVDHIRPHARGGRTTAANGQGYCAACNYAKEAPGWRAETIPTPGRHTVELTTPTGHRYRSRPPDPPGRPPGSPLEHHWRRRLGVA